MEETIYYTINMEGRIGDARGERIEKTAKTLKKGHRQLPGKM